MYNDMDTYVIYLICIEKYIHRIHKSNMPSRPFFFQERYDIAMNTSNILKRSPSKYVAKGPGRDSEASIVGVRFVPWRRNLQKQNPGKTPV